MDLTIYGDGLQNAVVSAMFDDLVAGLMALMYRDGDLAEPVNLGNPGEFTILELAELVLEVTKSRSGLVF